jgi:hypothetical protein
MVVSIGKKVQESLEYRRSNKKRSTRVGFYDLTHVYSLLGPRHKTQYIIFHHLGPQIALKILPKKVICPCCLVDQVRTIACIPEYIYMKRQAKRLPTCYSKLEKQKEHPSQSPVNHTTPSPGILSAPMTQPTIFLTHRDLQDDACRELLCTHFSFLVSKPTLDAHLPSQAQALHSTPPRLLGKSLSCQTITYYLK